MKNLTVGSLVKRNKGKLPPLSERQGEEEEERNGDRAGGTERCIRKKRVNERNMERELVWV